MNVALLLGAHVYRPHPKPPTVVFWSRPDIGKYTLNIDGSFRNGEAGIGGIIRNEEGHMVYALGFYKAAASALEAKIMATFEVLRWCTTRSFSELQVATDSMMLVKMVQEQRTQWRWNNVIASINHLMQVSRSKLKHIWREKNMVTDALAKLSFKERANYSWRPDDTPDRIRALVRT
ncbi:hypothetical protein LIER_18881 [Lithospermum erythrorhizon]|uniref:RNase H type-1 domain-containing protein n=1 Tax=Lithospermum erythrorhizon TaxID=34254 RepID=A0AAV3QIA0_LITER